MAPDRKPKKVATIAEPDGKTKPVSVDLSPAVHKELRRAAADEEISMAALARKVVGESVTRQTKGGGK